MSIANRIPPRGELSTEKADRLVASGSVSRSEHAQVYRVHGDHRIYRVIADETGIFCPCPARTPLCSHVLAVAKTRITELGEQIDAEQRRLAA